LSELFQLGISPIGPIVFINKTARGKTTVISQFGVTSCRNFKINRYVN